ncbi:hypothetical protein AMJ51_00870 [Microgenomates bacterium DG_75]|nr:MAG: hypothetical protein AMJ51_00870 [Microgenomates bacterium DG_75]
MEVGEEKEIASEQVIPLTPKELGELSFIERQQLRTESQKQLATLFKNSSLKKTLEKEVLEAARIIKTAPRPSARTKNIKEFQNKASIVKEVRMAIYYPRFPRVPKALLTVARSPEEDNHGDLYRQYIDWSLEHGYDFQTKWGAGSSKAFRSGAVFSVKGVDGPIIFFDRLDKKINLAQIKRMGYVVLNEKFEIQ